MARAAFSDLSEAVEWLREHWSARETPTRLHQADFEGEGPFFTPAFARYLDATPNDKAELTTERECRHLRLTKPSIWECPDCAGTGLYETQSTAYRYPMWLAMEKLTAYDRVHPRQGYSLHELVLTLVINSYDVPGTVRATGEKQASLYLAIRTLYERFERAPLKVGWTRKSEAQQQAEAA